MHRRRKPVEVAGGGLGDGVPAENRREGPPPPTAAALPPRSAFAALLAARLLSAFLNLIHDCDETFNYLEPLHFLMYNSGMQTWEYSRQFALRSYLYLMLHAPAVGASADLLGPGRPGKWAGFLLLKASLGLASAASEAWLYRAVAARYRPALAHAFLLFLCTSSGLFAASTAMLPSTFTMYALTAAAAGMLEHRPYAVIVAAVVGVVWGWCVAGLAFLPYALWVLVAAPLLPAVGALALTLLCTLVPLVLVDRYFYGVWTASLWNFIKYNVVGGGDSALYGVESATFYLRNGLNNFQLLLPLALLTPALVPLASLLGGGDGGGLGVPAGGRGGDKAAGRRAQQQRQAAPAARLLACLAPLYFWLAAISALPHKEERFLYVAYPLICLAAAASFVVLWDIAGRLLAALLPQQAACRAARAGAALFLAGTCLLAASRTAALLVNYGAPMRIYNHLPEVQSPGEPIHMCVGAEWYRFPSAFFLPGPRYRLAFIRSGFDGLLPHQFDPAQGGTAAAPPYFNDRNRAEPANFWPSAAKCDYVVTLRRKGEDKPGWEGEGQYIDDIGPESDWEEVAALPFVDSARSPPLTRAFYLPGISPKRNAYLRYVLLRRKGHPVT